MSRSLWKGKFIEDYLLKINVDSSSLLEVSQEKNLRNSTIIRRFVGLNCEIYNGKLYNPFVITYDMIGHKFGEFCFSTRVGAIKKYVQVRKKGYRKKFKLKKRPRTLRTTYSRVSRHHY